MTVLNFPKVASNQGRNSGARAIIFIFPDRRPEPRKVAVKPAVAPKAGRTRTKRDALITKVKIAQKQLGICDADYRVLLWANFSVDSSTKLEERELVRLISYFRSLGWQDKPAAGKRKDRHGKPKGLKSSANPAAPTLQRMEALLSELGKARGEYIPWSYAAAILKAHTGLDRLEQATVRELQKVMTALERTLNSARRQQA